MLHKIWIPITGCMNEIFQLPLIASQIHNKKYSKTTTKFTTLSNKCVEIILFLYKKIHIQLSDDMFQSALLKLLSHQINSWMINWILMKFVINQMAYHIVIK